MAFFCVGNSRGCCIANQRSCLGGALPIEVKGNDFFGERVAASIRFDEGKMVSVDVESDDSSIGMRGARSRLDVKGCKEAPAFIIMKKSPTDGLACLMVAQKREDLFLAIVKADLGNEKVFSMFFK